MLKITVAFLLTVATATRGQDLIFRRFAFIQAMDKCFGEKFNREWLSSVVNAAKECYSEPVKIWPTQPPGVQKPDMLADLASLLGGDRPVVLPVVIPEGEAMGTPSSLPFQIPLNLLSARQKRAALWDGPLLKGLMTKAISKVSNFTCVMKKTDIIDEDLNLNIDAMNKLVEDLKLNPVLHQDVLDAIEYCSKLATALPDDKSLLPLKIKQAVVFMKCDKDSRYRICMKQDLLKYLGVLDKSELPLEAGEEGDLAENLLQVLWGSETRDDFEVY